MLRRILLASAGATALAGTALAADLPFAVPPPPILTWTGLYVGLNGGYTWSNSNRVNTAAIPGSCDLLFPGCSVTPNYSVTSASLATFSAPTKTNGFIGGGQIGYNYQFNNNFVAGIEVDMQGVAGAHGSSTSSSTLENPNFVGFPIAHTASVSKSLNYLGTARGRLGFLITPTLLVYGTGGVAYGGVNASTSIAQTVQNDITLPFTYTSAGSLSNSRVGWTAGGGGEWLFWPHWSFKAEYLYYDLGSVTYGLSPLINIGGPGGAAPGSVFSSAFPRSTTRFNGSIVRAGLNFHF